LERNTWITIYTALPQIISLIVLGLLAHATWQRRSNVRWANKLLFVLLSIAIWDVADILELFSTSLQMYYQVIKFAYLGIATLPFFWLIFIIGYTGKESWISPPKFFLSGIVPVLTIIFTFSDESLHLMRNVLSYDTSGQFSVANIQYGPWFWVHSINSYIFLLFGAFLLIRSALTTTGLYTRQKIFLVSASLVPWISNILYLTNVTRTDYTSSAFTLLSFALAASVFRYQLLNIVPIAKDLIFENMNDSIIVLDRENKIIDLNPATQQIFHVTLSEDLGKDFNRIFPEFAGLLERPILSSGLREEIGIPPELPKEYYAVQINGMTDKNGDNLGKVIVLRNVTEQFIARQELRNSNLGLESRVKQRTIELENELETRKQIETALRESEERYSLAIQGANDGIWDWDLKTGQIFYSPRWKTMLGFNEDEGNSTVDFWFAQVHPDDLDLLKIEISRHLDNLTEFLEFTHRVFTKNGEIRWVLCRGYARRGEDKIAHRLSGSLTDITRQKQNEEQILHDAVHDPLTNLPNRTFFLERVSHSIQRAKRSENDKFAVLFLDLDRFKNINDSLGHALGDQLLSTCGSRINDSVRAIDTIARLGGDEFVVLINSISGINEVQSIVDRIIKTIAEPINLDNLEISVTASIGIVIFSNQYEKADEILQDADIAMYQAKRNNQSRYAYFDVAMRKRVNTRLELETELRHALEFQEFELFYQPIVKADDNHMVSFEALIRWNQPARGFVLPSDFIPIAEETGLILPIGQWVIREACRQISEWKKLVPPDYHISININLSARQFSDQTLCAKIRDTLQEFEIEANNLVLEITESTLIEDRQSVISTLNNLRGLGVQVHIDDFGTGYSSLSYLHTLPFDALKIDRSFVNQICTDGDCNGVEIIQTIISLGKELGKKVVAEGVETQDELSKLKELECGFIQGYLISRPMNKSMAKDFLIQEVEKETLAQIGM
jgi:diguanylate cyclase (GGDEF)-like protein/PAS domain S-box-containing protein